MVGRSKSWIMTFVDMLEMLVCLSWPHPEHELVQESSCHAPAQGSRPVHPVVRPAACHHRRAWADMEVVLDSSRSRHVGSVRRCCPILYLGCGLGSC